MSSLFAQLHLPRRAIEPQCKSSMIPAAQAMGPNGRGACDASGSANRECCSFIDESADLGQVEQRGRVYGAGSGSVVVDVRKGFEDVRGQLKPWAVEGGDVAPVPARSYEPGGLLT